MNQPTYESLEPLVASREVDGSSVRVLFRCERTGVEVEATGSIKRLGDLKNQAARTVKKNLWQSLRRSATRAVADTLGKGTAGRIARDLTNTTLRQGEKSTAFSQAEVDAAIVAAFDRVKDRFTWSDENGWTGAASESDARPAAAS